MRFTLQTLLLSVMVVWTSMAACGRGGLVLAGIILAAVAYIRSCESMWRGAAVVGVITLCGLCLVSLLLPFVSLARETHRRWTCINNLRQIGLGLHGYHDAHGCFPPAYIADPEGKPMHSWRVLILPYMEQQALYDRYDLSEPWDGPNNRKLAGQIPGVYQCPSRKVRAGGRPATNHVAVVGPKTVWPSAKATKLSDLSDEAKNTIMLVEVANSDINWMEPRDLSFEEALRGINPKSGVGISSPHVSDNGYFYHETPVVNVALADGTARSLSEDLSPEMLEALLTIDGGETIDMDPNDYCWPPARLNWANCFAPVALVVSVILLLVRPRRSGPRGPQSPGVDSQ